MGRGRPRKSIEQHLADGTYRADRHGPLPTADDPTPPPVKPSDLGGEAGEFWDQVTGLLRGVVRDRDAPLLAELCWQWAELRRIKAVIAKTKPGAKGYNQLLVGHAITTDKFDKIAGRFGLTPADRAKLKVEAVGPPKPKVLARPPTKLDRTGPPK
jgi:phage terminase small subunit